MPKTVLIYSDGACSGNPGPGGWGSILIYGDAEKELSGFEPYTTNQRMELVAALKALETLKETCQVELYSDSAYLINAFQQKWFERWERNGWVNAQKKPVENQDLWRGLLNAARRHQVTWIKVKGHADNVYNNRCDALARAAIRLQNEK